MRCCSKTFDRQRIYIYFQITLPISTFKNEYVISVNLSEEHLKVIYQKTSPSTLSSICNENAIFSQDPALLFSVNVAYSVLRSSFYSFDAVLPFRYSTYFKGMQLQSLNVRSVSFLCIARTGIQWIPRYTRLEERLQEVNGEFHLH